MPFLGVCFNDGQTSPPTEEGMKSLVYNTDNTYLIWILLKFKNDDILDRRISGIDLYGAVSGMDRLTTDFILAAKVFRSAVRASQFGGQEREKEVWNIMLWIGSY